MGKGFFIAALIVGVLLWINGCQKLLTSTTEEDSSDTQAQVTGPTVSPPTISISGGTYTESQTVTIQCATSGATIKYTTDGSDPKTSATTVIGNTVFVSLPMRIRAYATKKGMQDSEVVTSDPFSITSGIVFVSALGNDANQGTKDHPKQTIKAGIELANSLFEIGEVKVAQGTYPTYAGITLKSGISLYGSYTTDFSSRNLSSAVSIIEDKRTSGTCYAVTAMNITSSMVFDGFVVKGANTSSGDSVCFYTESSSTRLTIRNNTFINGQVTSAYSNSIGVYIYRSSPWLYNNVMYGGVASYGNYKIMISEGSPKIYNNTLIAGMGTSSRFVITFTQTPCEPHIKGHL